MMQESHSLDPDGPEPPGLRMLDRGYAKAGRLVCCWSAPA
jgi:hypothetical protein